MPSNVVLGLWPIAAITTVGVTESDARQTIEAAIDVGITTFDTAFSYGYEGQCDRLLGSFVAQDRDRFRVIGKVGQRWTNDKQRVVDATAETLTGDAEESLRRMGIEQFDLLMLHSPDPNVPIEQAAETIETLRQRGLCQATGVCNVDAEQRSRFASVARCDAIQCPLNLLQRQSLEQLIPECRDDACDVYVFWTLMKGLLAGRISRNHVFAEEDIRPRYEVYQGRQRRRAHDVLDAMKKIAVSSGRTIAQLSIGWALAQEGVTAALIGARRPEQIRETATATPLDKETTAAIDQIVAANS